MSQCLKCNKEFTKEDEQKGNFVDLDYGRYQHRNCPGTIKCHFCGQHIEDGAEVRTALGYKHPNCWKTTPRTAVPQANPSSWVVKRN